MGLIGCISKTHASSIPLFVSGFRSWIVEIPGLEKMSDQTMSFERLNQRILV
jgi:hypothetical protein